MALQLNLRPRNPKALTNPSLVHLFSSNSSAPSDPNEETTDTPSTAPTGSSQSSFSAYFSDVKARLKQQQQHSTPPPPRKPSYPFTSLSNRSSSQTSNAASLEETRKNLKEYQIRTSVPLPSEPSSSSSASSSQHGISFQELHQRHVMAKGGSATGAADSMTGGHGRKLSFETIRDSLRQLRPSGAMQNERRGRDSMSLSAFKDSLKLKPSDSAAAPSSTIVLGGTERLPASIFGKEMRERKEGESEEMKTEFLKMYSHKELGSKLRALRPDNAEGQNWFSLTELNERLIKLRAMEEKESESRIGGFPFKDLRESLLVLNNSDKKTTSA